MGSLIMPSDRCALYTIKPTLKIVPQDGTIPTTLEADSAGPMAKSALDLADLLDVIADPSKTTIPKGGYKSAVTGKWSDIRIGVLEPGGWLFPTKIVKYEKEVSEQMVKTSLPSLLQMHRCHTHHCFQMREWKAAYETLASVVKVVKPVTLLSVDESTEHGKRDINDAFCKPWAFRPYDITLPNWQGLLDARFKGLVEEYLASIDNTKVHTLEDIVKFNEENADEELPSSMFPGLAAPRLEAHWSSQVPITRPVSSRPYSSRCRTTNITTSYNSPAVDADLRELVRCSKRMRLTSSWGPETGPCSAYLARQVSKRKHWLM
jgi:amidase